MPKWLLDFLDGFLPDFIKAFFKRRAKNQATLDQGAAIRMEFTANMGKGFVPAERNRPDDAPIGLIPVDSLYSPVKKVSYKVENTRVGQELDYDKLTMQIETNGAVL